MELTVAMKVEAVNFEFSPILAGAGMSCWALPRQCPLPSPPGQCSLNYHTKTGVRKSLSWHRCCVHLSVVITNI